MALKSTGFVGVRERLVHGFWFPMIERLIKDSKCL